MVVLGLGADEVSTTGKQRSAVTDLAASVAEPPSNDTLAGATLIESWPTTIRSSAKDATREASDPTCADDSTVWYRIRPAVGGRFVVTLRHVDTEMSAMSICVLAKRGGGLREVGQLIDEQYVGNPESVAFNATAGSSYYVVIGVLSHWRDDRFSLTVEGVAPFVPTWPIDIAVGPDGALWFTSSHGGVSIGRITTTGRITRYKSTALRAPGAITVGPDGALWFTNGPKSVGRITTHGTITTYTAKRMARPTAITAGAGAVWFTAYDWSRGEGGKIGRISTTGKIRLYTDMWIEAPDGITAGPDGAIWFTNGTFPDRIGRISKTGKISFFTDRRIVEAGSITAGPDGALWFTNFGDASQPFIGRITVTGDLRLYRAPSIKFPIGITASPDGALWFANSGGRSIGRISVNGDLRLHRAPSINQPHNITAGADGTIWFTDANGSIGRISKAGVVSTFPPAKR
jgi:virginiamycin B lyase